jgi:hypothetical protein
MRSYEFIMKVWIIIFYNYENQSGSIKKYIVRFYLFPLPFKQTRMLMRGEIPCVSKSSTASWAVSEYLF